MSTAVENQDLILDSAELGINEDLQQETILSTTKFILLSLATLGIYQIWWLYKSWKFFKEREDLDIMPAARAIFGIFYMFQLMEKIQENAKSVGYTSSFSSGLILAGIIASNVISRLPDPFWMISFATCFLFIPPYKAFNYFKENADDINATEQSGFNWKQIILLVLGVIMWLLILAGMFLDDPATY